MKLNIKKMYQDTIHVLEKHQLEVTIAIAALSIIAAPAFAKDTQAQEEENNIKNDLAAHLHKVLDVIEKELDVVNEKLYAHV